MNKKGFTLMEVLTVIVIITILLLVTLPLLSTLNSNNNEEICKSYARVMEEYAQINNKSKVVGTILLSDLEGDGIKKIIDDGCSGSVSVSNSNGTFKYEAQLECSKYNCKIPNE